MRLRWKCAAIVAASTLGLAVTGTASASLLATDWSLDASASSQLYRVDTATGTATLIGSTGQIRMIGLVVDSDSTIYAISEETNSRLWRLSPTTGAATLVGSLGFNLQEGDMTISPTTGQMYVADGLGDRLYTVDKATAAATPVGSFGATGRDVSGLQFIGSTLYGLALRDANPDVFGTVDPLNGLFTSIGETGTNCGVIAALGRDPASGITFMACPTTDRGSDNVLYSLNLGTGAATAIGALNTMRYSVSGFSTAGDPVILIPEPGTLALLGLGLAGLAATRRRKQ
jgi:DNA-binding beta-propeller fold protein YncE